jgi:hypothetical protein
MEHYPYIIVIHRFYLFIHDINPLLRVRAFHNLFDICRVIFKHTNVKLMFLKICIIFRLCRSFLSSGSPNWYWLYYFFNNIFLRIFLIINKFMNIITNFWISHKRKAIDIVHDNVIIWV